MSKETFVKTKLYFVVVLLIGLAARIIVFNNETYIGIDGVSYMRLGKNFIEHGRYSFGENYNWGIFFLPGYPAVIGILNFLVRDLFLSAKIISISFSVLTIVLFYFIGKELYDEQAGLFASFVYAIHPSMLEISARVATESLFFFLVFFVIYMFMKTYRTHRVSNYILIGILIAASALTRPEGILMLLLLFIPLLTDRGFKDKKIVISISIAFILFLLITSPYAFFIKKNTGKLGLSGKAIYLPVILDAEVRSTEVEYDQAAYALDEGKKHLKAFNIHKEDQPSILDVIIKNPIVFIKGYLYNFKIAARTIIRLIFPVVLPLVFTFLNRDIFKDRIKIILIIFAVLYFVIYPSFFILEKLMFPTLLFLVLLSSIGFSISTSVLSKIFEYYGVGKYKFADILRSNIKLIIIALCFIGAFRTNVFSGKMYPVEHMNAGHYLKNNVSSEYEKLNVMHRVPWVSFYSDARYTMLPYADTPDVVNFAKRYRVDFIVIDERSSIHEWEMYDELMNMNKYSDEVDLVYEDDSVKLIRMFKVKY